MTPPRRLWVKVCGITSPEDAELALLAGSDAIGLNFVPSSKRRIDVSTARAIGDRVRGKVELVGVVADLDLAAALALQQEIGLDWLQLHGSEPPALLESLPRAFKAHGVGSAEDAASAAAYGGERLLVDARVPGELGGTGVTFDWLLVVELARERPLILAGGLHPDNVAAAVRAVRPFGVDTASGVELTGEPRRKDPMKLERFVRAARRASEALE